MAIYSRLKVLLAKPEETYGVDPTLTGAADAILAKNVSLRPMEGQDVPRNLIQAHLAGEATIPAGLYTVIEFDTELVPSGTAGVAPAWGPLMRGAGFAEVIEEDVSVTYTPVSEGHESLYIKYWLGPTLHALNGARADATITIGAQGIPIIRWTYTGLWVPPADVARAAPTLTAWKKPLVASKKNTPAFSANGVNLVLRSYSLKFGNQVEPRLLIPSEQIMIVNRAEALDLDVEVAPLATFNPFALAEAQTQIPVSIQHGTVAGSKVTISAPMCQVKRPQGSQENQGIEERTLNLSPLPTDAGNDQISIVLT